MARYPSSYIFNSPEIMVGKGPPLYLRLQNLIRQAVEQGELKAGNIIPPERDIAKSMGISRVTVRRAVDDLVAEGILTQRQGSGTYIANRVPGPMNLVKSFTEIMGELGKVVSSRWLDRSVRLPTHEEQKALKISKNDEVVMFRRIRLVDDEPVALESTVLPRRFVENPFDVDGSLYAYLGKKGLRPVKAMQSLRAMNIDKEKADLLDIDVGCAVLHVKRLSILANHVPIEVGQSWFPGDSFNFEVEINNPDMVTISRRTN